MCIFVKKRYVMKKIYLLFTCAAIFSQVIFSQVGVGTVMPTAELEVETTNTGLPALELNPQTSPTGSTNGQIAVIGDKLFMYDVARGKWLSMESSALAFGRNGNIDNTVLKSAGNNANGNSSYLMPFDGTIVYVTVKSNMSNGAQNKQFQVRVRKGTTNVTTTNVTTSASEFSSTTFDVDFSAGDYIDIRINNDGNGNVNNPTAMIWVKWRE